MILQLIKLKELSSTKVLNAMVVDYNQFQESDTSVSNVPILTYAKGVKTRSIMSIIFWKWKNLNQNLLKTKRIALTFIKLVESSSDNSEEDILHLVLIKEVIHTCVGMAIGKENKNLVVENHSNTESKGNNSSCKLFSANNLISKNSFSRILNLKDGNLSNFMLLRKIFLKKNFKKKQTKWENKNCLHFMNVQKVILTKLSKHIQNLVSENLLSKWKKKD